ncbi:MAG: hypothetical protein GXO27_07375 [Chlorobi bacterium]|nr:hypothetical protein [Chlorobiota bacterium]
MFKKETDRILVLRRFPYKDSHYIVDALTARSGKVSFSYRRGKSKALRHTALKLRPPRLLEIEYVRSPRFYPRITQAAYMPLYRSLDSDLRKTAVAFFMTEILRHVARDTDPALFELAARHMLTLDREPFDPDFHLRFLEEITRHLGIMPSDVQKGIVFATPSRGKDRKAVEEAMDYYVRHGRAGHLARRRLLTEAWLDYLTYHIDHFHIPGSHLIFSTVLGENGTS